MKLYLTSPLQVQYLRQSIQLIDKFGNLDAIIQPTSRLDNQSKKLRGVLQVVKQFLPCQTGQGIHLK